jgi:hypothetical protein
MARLDARQDCYLDGGTVLTANPQMPFQANVDAMKA